MVKFECRKCKFPCQIEIEGTDLDRRMQNCPLVLSGQEDKIILADWKHVCHLCKQVHNDGTYGNCGQ